MRTFRHLILLLALFPIFQEATGQAAFFFWPRENSVFQRSGAGSATVSIAGGLYYKTSSTWEYRVNKLTAYGGYSSTQINWTTMTTGSPGDVFNFNINLPTGWYKIDIRVHESGPNYTIVDGPKFGVGEVITIAGQSNAEGHPDFNTQDYPSDYPGNPLECIIRIPQTANNECSTDGWYRNSQFIY